MHWSRDWSYNGNVIDHALITWLSCTDHMADHTLITCLVMQRSRDYSWSDHVAIMHSSRGYYALIMWLITHVSRDWSCTDHVVDHTLITRLIMHWSRLYHALITWLPMHWSRGWSYTDHVTDPAMIMFAIIHWSCASGGNEQRAE